MPCSTNNSFTVCKMFLELCVVKAAYIHVCLVISVPGESYCIMFGIIDEG